MQAYGERKRFTGLDGDNARESDSVRMQIKTLKQLFEEFKQSPIGDDKLE